MKDSLGIQEIQHSTQRFAVRSVAVFRRELRLVASAVRFNQHDRSHLQTLVAVSLEVRASFTPNDLVYLDEHVGVDGKAEFALSETNTVPTATPEQLCRRLQRKASLVLRGPRIHFRDRGRPRLSPVPNRVTGHR